MAVAGVSIVKTVDRCRPTDASQISATKHIGDGRQTANDSLLFTRCHRYNHHPLPPTISFGAFIDSFANAVSRLMC